MVDPNGSGSDSGPEIWSSHSLSLTYGGAIIHQTPNSAGSAIINATLLPSSCLPSGGHRDR